MWKGRPSMEWNWTRKGEPPTWIGTLLQRLTFQTVWPRCATKSSLACSLRVNKYDSSIWSIGLCGFNKTWAKYCLLSMRTQDHCAFIVSFKWTASNTDWAPAVYPCACLHQMSKIKLRKQCCYLPFRDEPHQFPAVEVKCVSSGLFLSKAGHDAFSHLRNKFNWFEQYWLPSAWNFLKKLYSCCQPPKR